MSETQTGATTPTQQGGPIPDQARSTSGPQQIERRTIADGDYDKLPAGEQSKWVRTRDRENNSVWAEKADEARSGGEKVRVGELEVDPRELQSWLAKKAQDDLRKSTLPTRPEDYRATLPPDLKLPLPDGKQFQFNENDPALVDLQRVAHQAGWSQEVFSKVLAIEAMRQAKDAQVIETARAAEVAKLGANGAQRITEITNWMRGMVGDDLARAMGSMLVTEKIARGFEKLITKYVSPSGSSFSQAHRDVQTEGISDEQWATMPAGARLDYARGFDQSKFK